MLYKFQLNSHVATDNEESCSPSSIRVNLAPNNGGVRSQKSEVNNRVIVLNIATERSERAM